MEKFGTEQCFLGWDVLILVKLLSGKFYQGQNSFFSVKMRIRLFCFIRKKGLRSCVGTVWVSSTPNSGSVEGDFWKCTWVPLKWLKEKKKREKSPPPTKMFFELIWKVLQNKNLKSHQALGRLSGPVLIVNLSQNHSGLWSSDKKYYHSSKKFQHYFH